MVQLRKYYLILQNIIYTAEWNKAEIEKNSNNDHGPN